MGWPIAAHEISCTYEPAAGLQARKVSLFTGREGGFYLISCLLHLATTKLKKLTLFSMITRWSRSSFHSYLRLVKI